MVMTNNSDVMKLRSLRNGFTSVLAVESHTAVGDSIRTVSSKDMQSLAVLPVHWIVLRIDGNNEGSAHLVEPRGFRQSQACCHIVSGRVKGNSICLQPTVRSAGDSIVTKLVWRDDTATVFSLLREF